MWQNFAHCVIVHEKYHIFFPDSTNFALGVGV